MGVADLSTTAHGLLNDYCIEDWKQKFSWVDDADALVMKGCFMAKINLQNAYRHISISKQSLCNRSAMAIWQPYGLSP